MVCSVTPRINNSDATRERDGENEFREPLKSFESRAPKVSLDLGDEGGEAQGSPVRSPETRRDGWITPAIAAPRRREEKICV